MRERLLERIPFAKIAVVLAIAFGIGLGLCGVDAAFLDRLRSPGEEFGPNTFVGGIGAFAVVLSALSLVLTTIVWVVAAIVGSFGEKVSQPQKLFEEENDTKLDEDK